MLKFCTSVYVRIININERQNMLMIELNIFEKQLNIIIIHYMRVMGVNERQNIFDIHKSGLFLNFK